MAHKDAPHAKDARIPHELRKNGRAREAWEARKQARNVAQGPQEHNVYNVHGCEIHLRQRLEES